MVLPRRELPSIGEYVIATVREIYDYGAYVTLDEFGDLRAFLPWSEIVTKWVKNLREVIHENEKIVVKVIRVDRARKSVDVSLKKVSDIDKRRKMLWWKRYVKASKIVELVASKIGKSVEDAYREVVWKLEDAYGDPLYALEEAIFSGPEVFKKAGVPDEWLEPLLQEAKRHITVKEVVVRATIILQSYDPDGVEKIKKCLEEAVAPLVEKEAKFRLYTAGAPRYVLEVYSTDYKSAEKLLEEVSERLVKTAESMKLLVRVEREKA